MTEPFSPDALMTHAGFVRALAMGLLRDRDLADDVVQETMLAAIRRPPRDPERLRGWLGSVAKNLSLRVRRGRARRDRRERGVAVREDVPSAAEVAARLESEARLVSAVRELEEPYRTVVVLRYHDVIGPTEIARRLDEPVRTVETRLRRALAQLRAKLEEDGGDRGSWRAGLLLVLGGAPTAAAAPAATGSSTFLLGSLIMSLKTKIVLGVAAVALLSIATWKMFEPPESPPPEPPGPVAPAPQPESTGPGPEPDTLAPPPTAPEPPSADHGACHGRITYADGSPVAGEKVWPWNEPGSAVTTDADGRYHLEGVLVENAPRALMLGPRHACNSLGDVAIVPGKNIQADFTVERGLSLTLILFSPEPMKSVSVSLLPAKGEKGARASYGAPDPKGKLTLSRLPPGRYMLRVDGPGIRPHREAIDLTDGAPTEPHQIDLNRAEKLLVTVGNLRPGARPEFILMFTSGGDAAETYHRRGTVRDDGVIEETAPPPGTYRLTAFVGGLSLPSVRLEVPMHGAAEVRVEAPAGAEVAGRVVPADGLPAGGAALRLSGRHPAIWTPRTKVASDGTFRLALVPPGTYGVHLNLGDQTLSDVIDPITVGPEGIADLHVTLPAGSGEIEGRLVGYSTAFPASRMRNVVLSLREGDAWKPHYEVSPTYDGAFRAGYLPAGRWRIEVRGAPFGDDPEAEPVELDLGPGEKRSGIRLVARKAAVVTLLFETAAGEPFADPVSAHASPASGGEGRLLMLKPDSDGRCAANSLTPGVWKLMILGGPEPFTPREIEVLEGSDSPITIRLW